MRPAFKTLVFVAMITALASVLAFAAAIDGPAVVREFARMCTLPLWPNFTPDRIPVTVFDGSKTWLYRHPSPPPEFVPVTDRDGLRATDGRYVLVTANSSAKIGGVMTAMLLNTGANTTVRQAAVLMHEAFHVDQRQRHPDWSANEADVFLYPLDRAETLQSRRLESEALRRALEASGAQSRCWARTALDMRAARFGQLPPSAVEYERRSELNEGLAQYVEDRAAGEVRADLIPSGEFALDEIRLRSYATGEALALLLDRTNPPPEATRTNPGRFFGNWQDELDSGRTRFLDQALERRLAGAKSCEFYAPEKKQALLRAQSDVAKLRGQRDQALRDFHAQPGWRIVVEASGSGFSTQGFDPLNITQVGSGLILHRRYLKAAGNGANLELIDVRSLTEAAGSHPMFSGLRRITIAGLAMAPNIEEKDGGVSLSAPGLKGRFAKATVTRDDAVKQITITF